MAIIPAYYYFDHYSFTNIVRISNEWHEESGGYQNEHIYETIACIAGGKYFRVKAHLKKKTMGGEDFNILEKTEISQAEYDKLNNGIVDTEEYRFIYEARRSLWNQIDEAHPLCPKCKSIMTEREGRYGKFWGCPQYPKCDGTRKDPKATKKIKQLHDDLSDLNQQLFKLEKG